MGPLITVTIEGNGGPVGCRSLEAVNKYLAKNGLETVGRNLGVCRDRNNGRKRDR
ncbi:MAG: hypothetical protein ABSD49_10245 [Candidatus Bathyarchaeia archaeon]